MSNDRHRQQRTLADGAEQVSERKCGGTSHRALTSERHRAHEAAREAECQVVHTCLQPPQVAGRAASLISSLIHVRVSGVHHRLLPGSEQDL